MTDIERDRVIRDLAGAVDRLNDKYIDLKSCLVAAFTASALMIFLVVWFGGVNITLVEEPRCYPANVGELVETLETIPPQTPLEKEKTR